MRAFAVAVALAVAAPAFAAPGDAKAHYEKAAKFYDLGDFREALGEFKQAFLAHDDPVYLFNIAQCYRMMGDHEHAAQEYRAFLRRSPNAPNRVHVEEFIAVAEREMQRRNNNIAPTGPLPPATVTPATTPEPARPEPVVVAAPEPQVAPIVVVRSSDTPRPVYKKWWFWTAIAAVVVVAVVVGVVVAKSGSEAPIPSTTSGFTLLSFH